ncbi:CBO0543 family protein [Neobacillus cucumis]|uniref:CBO0543 family protein n=1 Tax=Neobacillus cucumis TaxID=1740721 RepID=UPI0019624FE8|nr:CBO0543 family protein [Neobacillus cucumis]MBM7652772.1 uncharacterized membrane protein YhaH (DUF805 family) [Neobacillus cucumis]
MWYWYLFLCVIIFNIVAICIKKKLKPIEMYATIVTCMLIQTKVDRWTDRLDWYGFFSRWFIDAPTLLVNMGLYPAAAIIMLNFYPYDKSKWWAAAYILIWSIASTGFEWTFLKMGYMYYGKDWNLLFSAFSYPVLYLVLLGNLKIVDAILQKSECGRKEEHKEKQT